MRLLTGVLAGLAAYVAGTAAAREAASPEMPAAPLDYVRVCDGSGAAFLTVPGTETCLVLGGRRLDANERYPADRAAASSGSTTAPNAREIWTERDFLGSRVPKPAELLAHTATFGEGFSTSLSFEEPVSRPVADFASIASLPDAAPISINGISAPSFRGSPAPEVQAIVGKLRQDQPLGAVQLDAAAALQVHAGLIASEADADPSPAYPIPVLPSQSHGSAGHGGIQSKDYLSPGDRLWLQAAYENGAYGTIAGAPAPSSSAERGRSPFGHAGLAPLGDVSGWRPTADASCARTGSFTCEPRWGHTTDPEAAKRERPPTFSSVASGSAQGVRYESMAIAGFGGAVAMPSGKETKAGPHFIGMPLSGFDIGAEFMYVNVKQARPAALPASIEPKAASAPGTPSEYQGRLRVQRGY